MRQWYKHVVGIETTSSSAVKDHAWNEISRRYVPITDFYIPDLWRLQDADNKQASQYDADGNPVVDGHIQEDARAVAILAVQDAKNAIQTLIDLGVAKELAQILLPLNFYTEVYWTASFQAMANFVELRDDEHAQWEIRQYAQALKAILYSYFPETAGAWFNDE